MTIDSDSLTQVAHVLARSRRVLVITGAGISADSGLPTYRGVGGLYETEADPSGRPIEDILSGRTLLSDPELCWRHLARVEGACRGAQPNRGHQVIAQLESPDREVVVLTQNVDGLHKDAGSTNVIEIHGTVRRLRCVRCAHREERADWAGLRIPPVCPSCGRAVRPDVVLFEESLPQKALRRLAHERNRGYDLVFSIGTTSGFPYIRQPVVTAAMMGIPTVEINPGFTEVSHLVVHRFANGAADTLDQLASALTASEEA